MFEWFIQSKDCLFLFFIWKYENNVVSLIYQNRNIMENIEKFNGIAFECIRKSNQCNWNGTTVHDNLEKAFVGMNLFLGLNSGSYIPKVIRINGAYGYYMINESGRVCFEGRVIKKDKNKFLIEYISNSEYEKIESKIYEELT